MNSYRGNVCLRTVNVVRYSASKFLNHMPDNCKISMEVDGHSYYGDLNEILNRVPAKYLEMSVVKVEMYESRNFAKLYLNDRSLYFKCVYYLGY